MDIHVLIAREKQEKYLVGNEGQIFVMDVEIRAICGIIALLRPY